MQRKIMSKVSKLIIMVFCTVNLVCMEQKVGTHFMVPTFSDTNFPDFSSIFSFNEFNKYRVSSNRNGQKIRKIGIL